MTRTIEIMAEIPGFVTLYADGSVERHQNSSPDTLPISSSQTFVEGVASTDVVLDDSTGVWARIFLPEDALNNSTEGGIKLPVVLYFHGGGFCLGSASWRMYHSLCSRMAATTRAIWVSVNYRLAPEHRLPTGCDDCIAAFTWLNKVAQGVRPEFESQPPWLSRHGDFKRCFLGGDSVGGNMAHQVALFASSNPGVVEVIGSILLHPGFVKEERSRSELENSPDLALVSVEAIDVGSKLALPEGSDKDFYVMNPWIPSVGQVALPRMLVIVGEMDVFHDRQIEYCRAMESRGQDLEVVEYKKMGHCFILHSQYESSAEALDLTHKVLNFMDKCIGKT